MRKTPIFLILFIAHSLVSQTWQDTVANIDKVLNLYGDANPGCQISIERNGEILYSKAIGMADLERLVPLTTQSVIEAGSVSKQFTAACILLLEQQGKLSIHDDIRKYLPEIPNYGNPIKIYHLLHHTSGIRDWGSVAALTGWPRSTKFYTNEDALDIIKSQKQLNNRPGDEYIYSNSNYNLQAIIVQRVSGKTLADYCKEYIFEPAGMTHTQWRDNPNRIVSNRAIAYMKKNKGYEIEMPNEYVYGNGGLLTTTEDLLKWSDYYQQGKLGTTSLLAKQIQTMPLNNGRNNEYGAGLFIKKVRGWNNISHSGSTASYRAYLETFPELELSIAILSNSSQQNINSIADNIRKIFVIDNTTKVKNTSSSHEEEAILVTPKQSDMLSGVYQFDMSKRIFHLSYKDSSVYLDDKLLLKLNSDGILSSNTGSYELKKGKGWFINRINKDTLMISKKINAKITPNALTEYQGKYFSQETNSSLTVNKKDNLLMVHLNVNDSLELKPIFKDAFAIESQGIILEFSRSTRGIVNSIKITTDRARNVKFEKVK